MRQSGIFFKLTFLNLQTMKKLTNKEKIKRLNVIKQNLKENHFFSWMCLIYYHFYESDLFIDIPEIIQFKPTHVDYEFLNNSWFDDDEFGIYERILIINLTINYIKNLV